MKEVNYWLTRFILEARRADGNLYPANTLYNISPTPKEGKKKKVENDEEEKEEIDEEGKETAFLSSCSVNVKHGKTRISFHFYCEVLDDFWDFVCVCVSVCFCVFLCVSVCTCAKIMTVMFEIQFRCS